MKSVVVANQKGGVGKTSSIVHLAYDFAERGLSVAVVDLDTQGNASFSLAAYDSGLVASDLLQGKAGHVTLDGKGQIVLVRADDLLADTEKLPVASVAEGLSKGIKALAKCGFDVCLFDTAPSMGNCLVAALASADAVITPIEMHIYSMQGVEKMNATINGIREVNPKLQFLGLVPSKVDRRNPRHAKHLETLRAKYAPLMAPVEIGLRGSIAEAQEAGTPVWKVRKTSARPAAAEMRKLAAYVYEKLEIAQ